MSFTPCSGQYDGGQGVNLLRKLIHKQTLSGIMSCMPLLDWKQVEAIIDEDVEEGF